MDIQLDRNSSVPLYVQIKNSIKNMIYSGMLQSGFSLPSERKLAAILNVSRSTVIKAYEELKSLGLLDSNVGKATIVSAKSNSQSIKSKYNTVQLSWHQFFNSNIAYANQHSIMDIMNSAVNKNSISFSGGIGDPELYPTKDIKNLQKNLWKTHESHMLTHCPVQGHYPFRESICDLLKTKNISASPKDIMVLSGSMQGIDFIGRAFINAGDIVLVEEPTFLGALQLFKLSGAKVIGVPMDQDGIKIDVLEILLNKYKPKFIYTIPTFHNPTCTIMSMEKRYELLRLSYRYQVPIIEDDPYSDINYEAAGIPSLKALDKYGYVIYLSSFSKTMFSGLRIGYTVAPAQVINKFLVLKQMTDLHSNTLSQYILDAYLREDLYKDHIKLLCKNYILKRNTMLEILKKSNNDILNFNNPLGGYYIWCKLSSEISPTNLFLKCSQKGVTYTPGSIFYPEENDGNNYVRLNFTYESTDNIRLGMGKFCEAINEILSNNNSLNYYEHPIV